MILDPREVIAIIADNRIQLKLFVPFDIRAALDLLGGGNQATTSQDVVQLVVRFDSSRIQVLSHRSRKQKRILR